MFKLAKLTKRTYSEAIRQVMLHNGYFAPLKLIYKEIWKYKDISKIKGKTPNYTIQERVQRDPQFTRIGLGIYALTDYLSKLKQTETPKNKKEKTEFRHTKIQGMLLEIGSVEQYDTYTPDRSKKFDGKPLNAISTLKECPNFTFKEIINHSVKYIDVIWFNERSFPCRVFEVEDSTDFRGAFVKFTELQDFMTQFSIIAPETREEKYQREIRKKAFKNIKERCKFISYGVVEEYYQAVLNYDKAKKLF